MMVATGHGNYVPLERVVGVSAFHTSLQEFIESAKRSFRCMDHTGGRSPRSIVHLDTGWIAITSIRPETMRSRIEDPSSAEREE